MATVPEEPFQVSSIQVAIGPVIDRLEGFLECKIVCILQRTFQLVYLQVVAHLFEDQLAECALDPHR